MKNSLLVESSNSEQKIEVGHSDQSVFEHLQMKMLDFKSV